MSSPTEREVKRVLVMVEHEEGAMSDVFDLTALVREIASNPQSKHQSADIRLAVAADRDYNQERLEGHRQLKTTLKWRGIFDYNFTGESGFLEDVINAGIQDTERVKRLQKAQRRARERFEKLGEEIKQQKLDDAAKIRGQHPIARVRLAPELLTAGGAE